MAKAFNTAKFEEQDPSKRLDSPQPDASTSEDATGDDTKRLATAATSTPTSRLASAARSNRQRRLNPDIQKSANAETRKSSLRLPLSKISLEVPTDLLRQLKGQAAVEGLTMTSILESLISQYLDGRIPLEPDSIKRGRRKRTTDEGGS